MIRRLRRRLIPHSQPNSADLARDLKAAVISRDFQAIHNLVESASAGRHVHYRRFVRPAVLQYCLAFPDSDEVLIEAIDRFLTKRPHSRKGEALRELRRIAVEDPLCVPRAVQLVPPSRAAQPGLDVFVAPAPPPAWNVHLRDPAQPPLADARGGFPPGPRAFLPTAPRLQANAHPLLRDVRSWPVLPKADLEHIHDDVCPITLCNADEIREAKGVPVLVRTGGVFRLFDVDTLRTAFLQNPENPVSRQPINPEDCFRMP